MANDTHSSPCTQEPRLVLLENTQEQILETLKTMKDLLASSIRTEERLITASQRVLDLEIRLRKAEQRIFSNAWVERLVFAVLTGAIVWVVKGAMNG